MTNNGDRATRNPLQKAHQVLTYLVDANDGGAGIREVARATGLRPTTVHRTMSDLCSLNLIRVDPKTRVYSLGPEFTRLAIKYVQTASYIKLAEPVLIELTRLTCETSYLCMFDSSTRRFMFIASVASTQDIRFVVPLYEWLDLKIGAPGIAIYSLASPELADAAAAEIAKADGEEAALLWRQELQSARRHGYAQTEGRRTPGALSVATPVQSQLRLCAIGVTAPASRVDESSCSKMIDSVRAAAGELTALWSGIGRD